MTAVKFCGITRRDDAWCAADLGAHAVGFVFWPRSPRAVSPDEARAIAATLPPFVQRVGVFVDAGGDDMRAIADLVGLDVIQLHGDETLEAALQAPRKVVKALGKAAGDLLAAAAGWPEEVMLLVDAVAPEARGGTGARADWTTAAVLARRRRIVLAGGLAPENVEAGIAAVGPYAVDVSSGVEVSPGRKDHGRMRAFVDAVARAWRHDAGAHGHD
jgi:phosphoribosylanthranilate isomerase